VYHERNKPIDAICNMKDANMDSICTDKCGNHD